jgi:hypothetical protein
MQGVLQFFRRWHTAASDLYKLLRAARFGRMFRMHALICTTADVT